MPGDQRAESAGVAGAAGRWLVSPVFRAVPFAILMSLMIAPAPVAAQSGPPGGMPPGGMPPGGAMPGRPPKPPKPLELDTLLEAVGDQHRAADVDRDGNLTLTEVREQIRDHATRAVRRRFGEIDADRSGAIDFAEFADWKGRMGSLVLSDVAAASIRTDLVPETLPLELGTGENAMILRMLLEPVGATLIVQADANADGRVDAGELQQHQRGKFDRLDANRDGALDFTELPRPGPREGMAVPDRVDR